MDVNDFLRKVHLAGAQSTPVQVIQPQNLPGVPSLTGRDRFSLQSGLRLNLGQPNASNQANQLQTTLPGGECP